MPQTHKAAEPSCRSGPDRPAGHADPRLGRTWNETPRTARPTLRLGLPVRRGLSATSPAGLVMPAANAETMSLHLTAIGHKVAAGSHAALVLDGAGYHIAAALTIPENVTLVRLPPYAPELNPMENVWEYLRGNKLAITVFDDYDDIVDKTCDAWNFLADDPMRIASITTRTWATVNK